MKFIIQVVTEKQIEIDLTDKLFCGMTHDQYLQEFRSGLWSVDGLEDVAEYAARMAAAGYGGFQHDGLGLLSDSNDSADVQFRVLDESTETEILSKEQHPCKPVL